MVPVVARVVNLIFFCLNKRRQIPKAERQEKHIPKKKITCQKRVKIPKAMRIALKMNEKGK